VGPGGVLIATKMSRSEKCALINCHWVRPVQGKFETLSDLYRSSYTLRADPGGA